LQANTFNGFPYFGHHLTPVDASVINGYIESEPLNPASKGGLEATPFGQLKWQNKKITIISGIAFSNYLSDIATTTALPRVAAQYRFFKNWVLRGNYSKGVRHSAPYYQSNTFYIRPENGRLLSAGTNLAGQSEFTRAAEGAIRYEKDIRVEGVFFWQEASNLVRPNQLKMTEDGLWLYGYQNVPGKGMNLWGIQGLFRSQNVTLVELGNLQNRKKNEVTSKMEFFLQYARGKEWLSEGAEPIGEVMNQPRWHTQFRTFFKFKQVELMFASNRQTSVLSKSVAYRDAYQLVFTQERYPTFRSWDMSARLFLSKQFLVYFYMQNMFNRHFAGLDATGTPDDLHFNAQQGRNIRFGVNYNLN
jgi:outer membrane receptor protein involved in Fe transport